MRDEIVVSRRRTTPMSTPNAQEQPTRPCSLARRADPDQMTHDESEIEATRHESGRRFDDVGVAAQMGAPHPARVVEMRKRVFDPFAALAHQAAAASSPHPATIAIRRPAPRDPSTNHVAPCPAADT